MNKKTSYIVTLAAAGLAASCGYSVPYQNSSPAFSKEGVEIALAGERCYVNRSAEEIPTTTGDDRLHIDVNLQVTNASKQPAVLSLEGFALTPEAKPDSFTMHPQESGEFSLAPGESRNLSLGFEKETDLDCRHGLALAADHAVAIAGQPVALAPIRFQPIH